MNPQVPLQGKVAFVTGAARRIGRSLALSLAEAGASVAITWRDSEPEAAQTVADLEALGVEALALRAELRDPAQVHAAVEAAIDEEGANSLKQMGAVVKAARAKLEGKAVDGKALSDRVRQRLSEKS